MKVSQTYPTEIERLEARIKTLEIALWQTMDLAEIANEGDPWFAEQKGLNADRILERARAALGSRNDR
jgi:hypothetical protein